MIEDILASKCSSDLVLVWHNRTRIVRERKLWLYVLAKQIDLGVLGGDPRAVQDYRNHTYTIDLESIRRRELVTRHDVKARIEEFNALAGHELIHRGMTSCDATDNIDQWLIRRSVGLILNQTPGALAKVTIEDALREYPLRGMVGAVGTGQDMLDLLGGSIEKYQELNEGVRGHLGFPSLMTSVGQVYPRSLDYGLLSSVWSAVTSSRGLPTRIPPESRDLFRMARGYLGMLAETTGDQWAEGDVSASVVRRVALRGFFFAVGAALAKIQ